MEERLKDRLFACMFDESEDALVGLDGSRVVRTWSRGAAELLGVPLEEAVDRDFAEFFPRREECVGLLKAACNVKVLKNYEARMTRRDGSPERVFLTVRSLGKGPEAFLVMISPPVADFETAPEHKAVQEALVRMERFSAVGRMAATFAHEMRTPLHVIASTAEFGLESLSPDSKMKENLEMILRNARHGSLSIRALLDFAKVGKSLLREGSLNEVARGVVRLVEKMCQKQRIELDVRLGDIPRLLLDEQHVRAVVHNLLVNAIEAMPKGGRLRVVTDVPERGGARLVVGDSGAGMAPEVLAKVSAPFFTTKEDGTGLGLYLAKRVLAEHEATISFDSEAGRGTAVTVVFPARSRP
ncbi:MAG: ATP-binding protein [Elusimicrobiota bacterium]